MSGLLILFEVYLTLLAAVDSNIGNLFSMFGFLCIFCQLMSYFGFSHHVMNVLSSDAATMFLGTVSFLFMMASVSNGNGISHIGFSFLLMGQVLFIDAFYGLLLLLSKNENA